MDLATPQGFALTLQLVRRLQRGSTVVIGIVCRCLSFSALQIF
jgi:hypothetical protein